MVKFWKKGRKVDIRNRQQLMNIIANGLEVYEFGKATIKPVEIIEYEDIEIVIYRKKID